MNKYVINYVYNIEGQVLAACAFDKQGNYGVSTISQDDRPNKAVAKYLALARMCMRQNTVKQFKDFWVTVDSEETTVSRIRGDVKFSALVDEMILFTRERAGKYFKTADTDNENHVYSFIGSKRQKDIPTVSTASEFNRLFGYPVFNEPPQWFNILTDMKNPPHLVSFNVDTDIIKEETDNGYKYKENDALVGGQASFIDAEHREKLDRMLNFDKSAASNIFPQKTNVTSPFLESLFSESPATKRLVDKEALKTPTIDVKPFAQFWAEFEAQYKEKYGNEKRDTDPK